MFMKFRYVLRLVICTFALWGVSRAAHAQNDYPLSVATAISSPYPLRFSDYEAFQDQVLVTVTRNNMADAREYLFYFQISLENTTNGNSLSSRPNTRPSAPIVLPQGEMGIQLTGADIEALQSGIQLSDFDVVGFNPNSGDQVLPEGNYTFCLTAHNFSTDEIDPDVQLSADNQGCGMFPVTYFLQPVITQPLECPTTIDIDDDQNLYIAWVVPGLSSTDDVEYKLYFTTVPEGMPDNTDPLQIINNSAIPPLVVQAPFEGVNNYFLDAAAGAEPPIVPGLRYVVRIQATSNTLAFQNNGFSDPCMIIVRGDDENAEGFSFEADYPNGGTIPFKQFPVITKMAPYSEDYERFEYRTVFRRESGVAVTQTHEYEEDNNWPNGPVRGQGLSDYPDEIARVRACYLPVYAAPGENPMVLEHGADYSWFMSGTVINDDNTRQSDEVTSETFQYGMPEPVLQTPADNARFQVNEGITFVWNTGEAPEKLFPTIPDIVRRSGSGSNASTREFHYGPVDERYVLQISRNVDFTELVTTATRSEALALAAFQMNDVAEAQAKRDLIYKTVNSGATPLQFSEGTYWWRVGWLQDPANQSSAFYQTSPTRKFCVGAGADCNTTAQNGGNNTPAQTGCLADCNAAEITDRTAVAHAVDDEVTIGKFEMTIKELAASGSLNSGYDGWGEIPIPFLNGLKIKVSFSNMKVNAAHRAFEGEFSVERGGSPVENLARTAGSWINYTTGGDLPLASEAGLSAQPIVQKLPVGWDQSIDGAKVVAVIDDLKFGLMTAELSIKFGYDMPGEFAGHPLIFKADRICVHPGGFQSVFRLFLAENLVIGDDRPENYRLVFPGTATAPPANSNTYSFVEFDCAGFKEAMLAGKAIFPRSALLPENPADATIISGEVEGTFSARLTRDAGSFDFISGVTFNHPFQIVGLEGWGFELTNAWIDMSDKRNPVNMGFPQGYQLSRLGIAVTNDASTPATVDTRLLNTWTGFYASVIAVRMRPEFRNEQAQRTSFQIDTLLIDPSGISASIYARNVIDIDDGPQSGGTIQGWRFTIAEIGLGIVQNTSIRGSMRGKIGMPVFRAGELLDYSMLLTVNVGANTSAAYEFRTNVPPGQTMHMDMWQIATATLEANSSISLTINSNDVRLAAQLHGQITLSGDMTGGGSVPAMDFAGIRYDNLRFGVSTQRGGFYFDEGSQFALASPQHNTAGFPVSIGAFEPVFDMQNGNPRVGIRIKDLRISLSQGSGQNFGASTTITFHAVANNFRIDALDQLSIDFDGVTVSKIRVEGDVGGGIRLGGEIEFYSDPLPSGGKKDGVRGAANITLPSLGAFNLFVEFGTVKNCTQCPDFNTSNQYYPYFSIEAMVRLSSGITIFPGVAIMGIGGGIWYNMEKLSEGQLPSAATLRSVPATDSSAQHGSAAGRTLRFEPKWGTLGFSLRALFGPPTGGVYGLAVKVEVEVNTAVGALTYIAVGGDAFFLPEDQNNPDSAPITAACEFRLSNEGNNQFKFTGWLEVKLAYPRSQPLIRGAGANNELVTATFYADDDIWHFYLGHMNPNGYDEQVGRNVGRAGMLVAIPGLRAEVSTYFMIGTPIPSELPDLPPQVEQMLSSASPESREKLGEQALSGDNRENPDRDKPDGSGVAFGAHLYLGVEPNFAIFYASLEAWVGVDLLLERKEALLCANGGNGLDGWRAKGQAYVGLRGEIGVGVDIDWLCNDCRIPIISIYAAVALRAELPNPEYFVGRVGLGFEVLGGLIKGQCNFKMELGEKCNPDAADLGGIAFIGGMSPAKTADCNQYERNVNPFTSPSVSFNVNMNETQSFIDDDGRNCKVKPKLLQCYVENVAGNRVVLQKESWNTDHTVYTLEPAAELPGLANFKFVVALGADKQCDNGPWAPVRSSGSEVVERAESCFLTGENAKNIPESNTRFAWPLKNQRFFMSEQGLYSFIKLKQWQSTLLDKPNTYDYYFRIKTLDGNVVGGANHKLPATMNPQSFSIIYNMPSLEPQRTYAVQFVRKRKVNPNDPFRTSVKSVKAQLKTQTNTYAAGTEYASTDTITTRSLPDQIVLSGEELLYSYYFRTSQHRTILEKMNTVQLQNTQLASNTSASWLEVDMKMIGEGWEEYDLSGYTANGTLQVEPLLDMTAPFDRFAQKQEVNNKIYTPYNTRYLPAGIRYYFNFVPGIGWYRTDLLNAPLDPTTQIRIKRAGGYWAYLFSTLGEPPLNIDEISGQVQEEILRPRPILPPGAPGSIAPNQTAHSYTLMYETHKTVNQHRSQLLELYQQVLASKMMSSASGSLTFKLSGSVNDIYNWMRNNYGSRKGDINACNAIEGFIQNPSYTLESHGMDYWNGLFRCETPAGAFGWDKQGLITGAVQEQNRLTEAQFNTLRNSDRNNRTLLRSLQTPLLQRISVGAGSYGVRFDFNMPTVGITSAEVSIPANIARIDRSFEYVGLLGNWAFNGNNGIFQNLNAPPTVGSNGTFPTPLNLPLSSNIVLPPVTLYPVTNVFQFSSFFNPHP